MHTPSQSEPGDVAPDIAGDAGGPAESHECGETIVAIATPPGRGGVGIVRLSGPRARAIALPMLRLRSALDHARARFAEILDPETQEKLDEALVTCFTPPRSYTGEEVVEIAAHGSPVLLDLLVRRAIAAGARLAAPGEFTERAFLNGRVDLTQAEGVRDLIEAQTLYQARVAAQQMGGSISRSLRPIKRELVDLIALLEAGIDFAEDDIDTLPAAEILSRLERVRAPLQAIADSFKRGRLVQAGIGLAIVGRPNAGKSSLFNCLLQQERAIVTSAPGTTRDTVRERISIEGIPVELIDTAGLREAQDEAERIGIQKSREALADAEILLLVLDASQHVIPEERDLLRELAGRKVLVAINKVDLPHARETETAAAMAEAMGRRAVRTSARTGEGLEELKREMLALVSGGAGEEGAMLTTLRHSLAVNAALESVAAGKNAAEQEIPHEMLLLDLYAALRSLDSLTGETTADDVLNLIFSTFCIGK
jgi:tRNA modification GTPase